MAKKTKKEGKFYFICPDSELIFNNKEDVLGSLCGGETVYKVKVVETYDVVDESIKLVLRK